METEITTNGMESCFISDEFLCSEEIVYSEEKHVANDSINDSFDTFVRESMTGESTSSCNYSSNSLLNVMHEANITGNISLSDDQRKLFCHIISKMEEMNYNLNEQKKLNTVLYKNIRELQKGDSESSDKNSVSEENDSHASVKDLEHTA